MFPQNGGNALTGIATLAVSVGVCGFETSTTFRLSARPKKTVVPVPSPRRVWSKPHQRAGAVQRTCQRHAVWHANGFLAGKTLNANQIHFVNLVIDYLTQAGWMSAAQLYESPFTDFSPRGVEGVFDSAEVTQLISVLDNIRQTAAD